MSDVPERLNLGLRAKDAPGKAPGSGCGCGRHGESAGQKRWCGCGGHGRGQQASAAPEATPAVKRGCGCGGHGRRLGQATQPVVESMRAAAAAEAAKLAAELGVELPENPAAATDLEA